MVDNIEIIRYTTDTISLPLVVDLTGLIKARKNQNHPQLQSIVERVAAERGRLSEYYSGCFSRPSARKLA